MDDMQVFNGYGGDPDTLLGNEEILGRAMEILGYPANSTSMLQSPAAKAAISAQLAHTRPILKHVPVTKKRVWPIAFGPTSIPPGQSVVATANPQVYFRGQKLINTGDDTGLYIQQITVGNQQQLPANTNPISVRSFDPGVLENAMKFDTCQPALTLSLQVANLDTATHLWSMTLFGTAAQ
jgi:hypothetical protein